MNGYYRAGLVELLAGGVNVETDHLQATLVRIDRYSVDLAKHAVIADVPENARLVTVPLTGVRVDDRNVFIDNLEFKKVGLSDDVLECEIVFWKDTGDESTSRLFAYMGAVEDVYTSGYLVAPFPVRTNGGDVILDWNGKPWLSVPFLDWDEE